MDSGVPFAGPMASGVTLHAARIRSCVLAWALLLAPHCWAAGGGVLPARVAISPSPQGVRVEVEVARPTASIPLEKGLHSIASARWAIDPATGTFGPGGIDLGAARRRYVIDARPDDTAGDRVYPAVVRLGDCGLVVRPGAFVAVDTPFEVRFDARGLEVFSAGRSGPPRGAAMLRSRARNELFFLVRRACVRERAGFRLIVAPGVPAAVADETASGFADALARYEAALGPSGVRPVLALTRIPASGTRWRGDVDRVGSVLIRLYGRGWDAMSPALRDELGLFVHHEAFHLWNGVAFPQREGESRAWLAEGAAEYAAYVSLRASGRIDGAAFAARLSRGLNSCMGTLDERGLDTLDRKGGSLPYECGIVVHWLLDGGGRGAQVLSVWRRLFGMRAGYDWRDFLRAAEGHAPPDAVDAVRAVLEDRRPDRAGRLRQAVRAIGWRAVDASAQADHPDARRIALFHLLAQDCASGPFGYTTGTSGVKLDTGTRCDVLRGDPLVHEIEGQRIGANDPVLYATIARACAAGTEVTFRTADGDRVIRCTRPLRPLPPRWRLEPPVAEAAPPLPVPPPEADPLRRD